MKRLILSMLALMSISAHATDLFCLVGISAFKCSNLYDVFMADDVCFKGEVSDANDFKKLGLTRTSGIKFLEGQVSNENQMLIFVEESQVEQMRYINRCN